MDQNILIVDDSATMRAVVKRTLGMAGISTRACLEAHNGSKALEILAANPIDLVLADLHMPVMGGVEMTRRMLADERLRSIPVIVISAEPSDQRLAELKSQGVRGCIRKPFTPESLRSVIQETVGVSHE